MDPYLEGDDWTSFHALLVTEIARYLSPRLRPKYVALPQRRFEVVDVPQMWVEIRDVAGRTLVTTVEILSPWNKRGQGREEYLDKRRKVLMRSSHLVEIDLLRRGKRLPMKDALPPASYYVVVARANERPKVQVWPIALDHPLPTFGVPLLGGDADVALDLQTCFQNVCDLGAFDLLVDYSKPPAVPRLPPRLVSKTAA
ncbi:MAG: hypothetical protein B7Z73_12180 [Planctomycetia bacterium 21-64-5]|nr:MAG: hypothetical protein B7Z73_12180 [Planctomycetia bacterium 21-64-5]